MKLKACNENFQIHKLAKRQKFFMRNYCEVKNQVKWFEYQRMLIPDTSDINISFDNFI